MSTYRIVCIVETEGSRRGPEDPPRIGDGITSFSNGAGRQLYGGKIESVTPIATPAPPTTMTCACGEGFSLPTDGHHSVSVRARWVVSHSSPAYYGLDWDPRPRYARVGSQVVVDGAIIHDCAPSAAFL